MRRRRIRPPWRRRLRRWVLVAHPRAALLVHRIRRTVRSRPAATPSLARARTHPDTEVGAVLRALGDETATVRALHVGDRTSAMAQALEALVSHVHHLDAGDAANEVGGIDEGDFDVAIALEDPELVDALLTCVPLVITRPSTEGGRVGPFHCAEPSRCVEPIGDGLVGICRSVDPVVAGVRYVGTRTRVRGNLDAPLRRRHLLVDAMHPTTGVAVFVKWIGTTTETGHCERREALAELRALRALQRLGHPVPNLPHVVAHEVGRHHVALVLTSRALPTLQELTCIDGCEQGVRILADLARAESALEAIGLHHPDVVESNIGIGDPCVLYDLGGASTERLEPFDAEVARIASAIRERLDPADHDAWDQLVERLPTGGPAALLEHLERNVSR